MQMSYSGPPSNSAGYVKHCIERGMSLLLARRLDEAMAEFNDALRADPSCADAHFGIAECLMLRRRTDDALARYMECLRINPGHARARFGLGNILMIKGKINEATRVFMMVSMADPGHVQARFNLGKCLEKKGQVSDALESYRGLTVAFPDFLDAYLAAADCLVTLGRADEAAREYRRAIARFPDRIDLRDALIRLLEREGRFEEAIAEHRAILVLRPGNIEIFLDIASAMDRGGMISKAIDEYARVLERDPEKSLASIKSRILLRERDQIFKLTDRYLGMVINRMDKIGSHFREGMKMYLDGCFEDALPEFELEIAAAPTADAYFGMGACVVRTGNLLAAVPRFRSAIRINPDFPEAHTMLGILYERHDMLYEAYEEYAKGVPEARARIETGENVKDTVDRRASEPSFKFFHL